MGFFTFILLPKSAIIAEIHKTDCANDCGVRAIPVSREENPQIKPKGLLGKICFEYQLLILYYKFQYLIS